MSKLKLKFNKNDDRLEIWSGGSCPIAYLSDEDLADLLLQLKQFIGKQSPEFMMERQRKMEANQKKIMRYVARQQRKAFIAEKVDSLKKAVAGFFGKDKE